MSDNRAFWLYWDFDHVGDLEIDASIIPFDGMKKIRSLINIRKYDFPEKIYFEAIFDTLLGIDFPVTDIGWPILSKKMYEVLTKVGDFKHKAIPIIMLDASIPSAKRFDSNQEPLENVANYDYVAVQITEYSDFFDYERSVYEEDELAPGEISFINNFVLKEVPFDFPPLFRIKEARSKLFVSAKAKEALLQANINGCEFRDLSILH